MTPDEITEAIAYNKDIDHENEGKKAEVISIDKAIEKYNLEFVYWCAPIDYGDQKIPGTNDLLTPKTQWK